MIKILVLSVLLASLGFVWPVAEAQTEGGMEMPKGLVLDKYQNKLKQADSFLRKGKQLFAKAEAIEQELSQSDEVKDAGPLRVTRLQERRKRMERKAGTYIEDAHRLQHRVLAKALRRVRKMALKSVEKDVERHFQEGEVVRRKADNLSFQYSGMELFHLAAEKELEGLAILKTAIEEAETYEQAGLSVLADSVLNKSVVGSKKEALEVMVSDTVPVKQVVADTARMISGRIVHPISLPESREELVKEGQLRSEKEPVKGGLYYTVQFLASRKPLIEDEIKQGYKGPLAVQKNKGDGWYRYSCGVFFTLEAAQKALRREEIKGFVVAYLHDKRITIQEALNYEKENKLTKNRNYED